MAVGRQYPAFFVCPQCRERARNFVVPPMPLGIVLDLCRHSFPDDKGKPNPSRHLIVCQKCHFPFKMEESHLVVHNPQRP